MSLLVNRLTLYCNSVKYFNMLVYLLQYRSISQKSYLATNLTRQYLYLFSALDVQENTLTYIYRYSEGQAEYFAASYLLLSVCALYGYSTNHILSLDVLALNIKGISLYLWLNYQVLIQRKIYSHTSSKYNLTLVYANLSSRNFRKRYLVFRYCKY